MPDVDPLSTCFVDTNVWLYAFLPEGSAPKKRAVAQSLVARFGLVVSTQIINEFCFNAIRKGKFSEAKVIAAIGTFFQRCRVAELTESVLLYASALRGRYSFAFWDSLIVSTALASDAAILYLEDMQDGLVVDGKLRIVNPFK